MPPNEHKIIAQIIARCWTDPAYRAAVIANPTAEFQKAGVPLQPGAVVYVHESNLANRHFIIPPAPQPPNLIPASDAVALFSHQIGSVRPTARRVRKGGASKRKAKAAKKGAKKGGKKRAR